MTDGLLAGRWDRLVSGRSTADDEMIRFFTLVALALVPAAMAEELKFKPGARIATPERVTGAGVKIWNFNSPHRVAGKYFVVFRDADELRALPSSSMSLAKVLPGFVPKNRIQTLRLARAYVIELRGELSDFWYRQPNDGFVVSNASETAMLSIVGTDSRIEAIEAVSTGTLISQ